MLERYGHGRDLASDGTDAVELVRQKYVLDNSKNTILSSWISRFRSENRAWGDLDDSQLFSEQINSNFEAKVCRVLE